VSTENTNAQMLTQQLSQLTQLEITIDTEKAILQQQDPDKLSEITNEKNQILLSIQTLDSQLAQSLQFKKDKAEGLFAEQLSTIETILLRCKDKNFVNGQIIEQSQLAVERMKTSLLQNHNKSSMTYDSKGKTNGGLSILEVKA